MSRRRRVLAPSPVEDGRGWGEGAASRSAATLAAALLALVAFPALADGPSLPNRVAQLQGLDKVTARVSAFDAPVGKEVAVRDARDHGPGLPRRPADRAARERRLPRDPRRRPGRRRQAGVLGLDVRLEPGPLGARAPGLRRLGRGLRRPAAGAGPGHATAALARARARRGRTARARVGKTAWADRAAASRRRYSARVISTVPKRRQVLGDELGVEQAEAAGAGAAPPARPGPPSLASRSRENMLSPKKAPPSLRP